MKKFPQGALEISRSQESGGLENIRPVDKTVNAMETFRKRLIKVYQKTITEVLQITVMNVHKKKIRQIGSVIFKISCGQAPWMDEVCDTQIIL